MTNRHVTIDELIDRYCDVLDIAREDKDYEAINLVEDFVIDLRDLERSYAQH